MDHLGEIVPSTLGQPPEITVTITLFVCDSMKVKYKTVSTWQWQCWIFGGLPCDRHSLAGLPSFPADLHISNLVCQNTWRKPKLSKSDHLSWKWPRRGWGGGWGWRCEGGRGWLGPPSSSSQGAGPCQKRGQYSFFPSHTIFFLAACVLLSMISVLGLEGFSKLKVVFLFMHGMFVIAHIWTRFQLINSSRLCICLHYAFVCLGPWEANYNIQDRGPPCLTMQSF